MPGKWRKNENDFRSSPLDINALKLHNLAKTATKLNRDCMAILPRINWTKPNAADRCRHLIGVKFNVFFTTLLEAASEFDTSAERVYRNIISWSPTETLSTLLAVAKWDSRQTHPKLKGLPIGLLNELIRSNANTYWLMDQEGPISISDLELLLPNHPKIVLRAHFYSMYGLMQKKHQFLVKATFKAADCLDWGPRKSTALEYISALLHEHHITGKFNKSVYFALSKDRQEEILKNHNLYPNLISNATIIEIRDEISRRKIKATERYKKTSVYLTSVIASGNFNSLEFLTIMEKAQSSNFHENALKKGIKLCRRVSATKQEVVSAVLNLPNKQSNISLKFLVCNLNDAIQSISSEDNKAVVDSFLQLNSKQQERIINKFDLKKLFEIVKLKKSVATLIQILIQKQIFTKNVKISALGVSNALIAVKSYNLNLEKSIRLLLYKPDGPRFLLSKPKTLEPLFLKFSESLKMLTIRKIKSYRSNNLNQWGKVHAHAVSKYFPHLIFNIVKENFTNREIYELIKNDRINELLEYTSLKKIIASPGWRRNLTDWKCQSKAIPPSIIKLAKQNKLITSELARYAAKNLQQRHLKMLSLKVIATHFASRADLCVMVDKSYSESARVDLIPWAQVKWKDKPAYSAAVELALAFGFKHAAFLSLLSKKIRPPFNEAKRGKRFDRHYKTYEIPKKSGGIRVISEPTGPLKAVQKSVLEFGLNRIEAHPCATGFIKGKSIIDNAAPHTNQSLVVNLDIRGFFPETNFKLIRQAVDQIVPKELSDNARWFLAELLAYKGGLPAGAPTSPALANVILYQMDETLSKASENIGVAYTRYADDISFSGDKALSILPFARQVASGLGYEFDRKKTNVYRRGRRQLVTGLVVNDKPNMAKPLRKRLRAAVHAHANGRPIHWNGRQMTKAELLGRIAFLAQIQPKEAQQLRESLNAKVGNE